MAQKRNAGWRDEAAAGLMARTLSRLKVRGDVLVMLDGRAEVAEALRSRGANPRSWHRMTRGGIEGSPWPTGGPYAAAALRLPKAKDELEMAVHAAGTSLKAGGRLWVYGANDEGAGSAAGRIGPIMGPVATIATGSRCRVLGATRPQDLSGLLGTLDDWRRTTPLDIDHLPDSWISYPGVFAHGRVDDGTRALLRAMPAFPSGTRVLDFACGSGLVGAFLVARDSTLTVDFLDSDAVALEAVQRNLPGVRSFLSDGLNGLDDERYDLIVSNPPYHEGKGHTERVLGELITGAGTHLSGKGTLLFVTQRRLNVAGRLEAAFRTVQTIVDEGPFRVWRADQ